MMHIHTAKQDAIAAIQRLPDTPDMEEIMYRLYMLENIRHGQEDAAQGKTVPAERVMMTYYSKDFLKVVGAGVAVDLH